LPWGGEDSYSCLSANRINLVCIHETLVFDRAWLSLRYFVWEFCRFLWLAINEIVRSKVNEYQNDDDNAVLDYATAADIVGNMPPSLIRMLYLEAQYDQKGWKGTCDTGVR
jgi:hypothetical protein